MKYTFHIVDVFSSTPFGGNQLAVLPDAAGICEPGWLGPLHEMFGRKRRLPRGPMAETFEAYRTRVLSYLGDEDPINVQRATPSQLERRLRDVATEELIRRPAPEKWLFTDLSTRI